MSISPNNQDEFQYVNDFIQIIKSEFGDDVTQKSEFYNFDFETETIHPGKYQWELINQDNKSKARPSLGRYSVSTYASSNER